MTMNRGFANPCHPMSPKEAGRLGGLATKKRFGKAFFKEIGTEGGHATIEKHGPSHMSEIGRIGGLHKAVSRRETEREANNL